MCKEGGNSVAVCHAHNLVLREALDEAAEGASEPLRRRLHTSAYVSIRQHTSAYASIRQHTPAHASIRQHTSAYVTSWDSGYGGGSCPAAASSSPNHWNSTSPTPGSRRASSLLLRY